MVETKIKFSLIVATVGRTDQLTRLLESLRAQVYKKFEVIIVDQNPPGFLDRILAPFQTELDILHLRSAIGLSLARNVGLRHVSGDVVAFPDDDCWYAADVLVSVANLLTKNTGWDGLTVRLADPDDPNGFRWYHDTSGPVSLKNMWHRSISVTIFLRQSVVRSVGDFDKRLGRGTSTGMYAAEESDYLIRVLNRGFTLYYCSDICLYHRSLSDHDERRALAFGEGQAFGYVLRKYDYPLLFVMRSWIRALGGATHAVLYGRWPRARFYHASFRGRILGWFTGMRSSISIAKELSHETHDVELAESFRLKETKSCSETQVGSV